MDALCATGMSSISAMGDKEGNDISGEGAGKEARGTSSADNGIIDSGEMGKGVPVTEWVVSPVDGSFGAGGSSGGEKRRLCCLAASARDVSAEKLRRCFSPGCHLRTPPLALALARRARETALRPKDTIPSRGLTLFDLVPVL